MHVYRHQIRYHETDAQGFLFNARYLEIADVAMTEFLRALGHRFTDLGAIGFDPSLVKAEIAFRKPTHFDEVIDVDATCSHVGRSSFVLHYAMSCDAAPVCDVDITYVNIARETETSAALPALIADALRAAVS
ncbi:hypothetical protein nbrc107696_08650 [Gordonia spumicola]|uniref:Thioesterase domain-containing protein n=1 Tax=Gordonia spumicola TaxID=589161 RepID=A0A7I9V4S5_9ACTN|nr:thioesterase family protein [Gordonia spumicola]GEE00419.1 hypothetical protein nbrc107696_08650 [Gordonia spumicola]